MTVFVFTWNNTFLTTPADTEDESLGAQRIRDTRNAVGERFVVDHSLVGDANDGKHTWATLRNRGAISPMGLDVTDGRLFASQANGNTELYYQDSSGRVLQVTVAGVLNTPIQSPVIPSGTVMFFAQAAPPVGWTLAAFPNDTLIRINQPTAGQGNGGAWAISGLTTQNYTLQIADIPNHTHDEQAGQGGGGGINSWILFQTGSILEDIGVTTTATGGGGPHNHGAVAADGTWRPPTIDVLVATKN